MPILRMYTSKVRAGYFSILQEIGSLHGTPLHYMSWFNLYFIVFFGWEWFMTMHNELNRSPHHWCGRLYALFFNVTIQICITLVFPPVVWSRFIISNEEQVFLILLLFSISSSMLDSHVSFLLDHSSGVQVALDFISKPLTNHHHSYCSDAFLTSIHLVQYSQPTSSSCIRTSNNDVHYTSMLCTTKFQTIHMHRERS